MEAVRRGRLEVDCRGIARARQRENSMLLQLALTRASDAH